MKENNNQPEKWDRYLIDYPGHTIISHDISELISKKTNKYKINLKLRMPEYFHCCNQEIPNLAEAMLLEAKYIDWLYRKIENFNSFCFTNLLK